MTEPRKIVKLLHASGVESHVFGLCNDGALMKLVIHGHGLIWELACETCPQPVVIDPRSPARVKAESAPCP